MLQLLVIFVVFVVLMFMVVWLMVEKGWGFLRPKNNIEYIVLRGDIFDHSIRGYVDKFKTNDGEKDMETDGNKHNSLLYRCFGICYFGFPGIYKLGKVIVNYPASLRGASGKPHTTEDIAPGFTVHRNYLVYINVDFQGGISFEMQLNVDVELAKAIFAWGRNGKFLDPLAQLIEGVANEFALTTNATDFIGRTSQNSGETETLKEKSNALRTTLCKAIMNLNTNTNKGSSAETDVKQTPLEDLCGYRIKSISYKNIEPANQESKDRLEQLEELNQSATAVLIAEQKAKETIATAKGQAEKTELEGKAKAAVDQAIGMADVKVLEAKKKAVGQEVMIAELTANAIRDSKITTYVAGGGSGTPPIILPLK